MSSQAYKLLQNGHSRRAFRDPSISFATRLHVHSRHGHGHGPWRRAPSQPSPLSAGGATSSSEDLVGGGRVLNPGRRVCCAMPTQVSNHPVKRRMERVIGCLGKEIVQILRAHWWQDEEREDSTVLRGGRKSEQPANGLHAGVRCACKFTHVEQGQMRARAQCFQSAHTCATVAVLPATTAPWLGTLASTLPIRPSAVGGGASDAQARPCWFCEVCAQTNSADRTGS